MGDGLRIGLLGSGFIAGFHLQALQAVRDATVTVIHSPTAAHRERAAAQADALGLGPCRAAPTVDDLVTADDVDAVFILGPNGTRLEHMRAIHAAVTSGRTTLRGVACEKPLARTLGEAREMQRLAEDAGLAHAYLENQVFAPSVMRGKEILWRRAAAVAGRPYLARAAEEHSGPHEPWFWRGEEQGGGVLLDMMCHSVEVARHLLTAPDADRASLRVVSASGTTATLKWSRPEYVERLRGAMGPTVDYAHAPAEDFARGTITLEDADGHPLVIEASTSWAYVGPGLRIAIEVMGPEYSLDINTLSTTTRLFLSREVTGSSGEDLVEKQNAEHGLMPILDDEAAAYGYVAEDRHVVRSFLDGTPPLETFADGVAVIEILMALYRSAELGRTVTLPDAELEHYVPVVARPR
ncbi:MAG TPA: Gfo/Idh/MocA family oxidoreductase [Mycobacteriales bacterium]|nr:Gfo/Idh/MocA family oxidoreductase [Mycobacteriales bacterium]